MVSYRPRVSLARDGIVTSERGSSVTSKLKTVTNIKSLLESDGKIVLLVSHIYLKAHNTSDASIGKDDGRTSPHQSTTKTKNEDCWRQHQLD